MTARVRARALAQEAIARAEPLARFERLYREAATGEAIAPCAGSARHSVATDPGAAGHW